jgi:predicted phosphodiesterase
MASVDRRAFLKTVAAGAAVGLSSSTALAAAPATAPTATLTAGPFLTNVGETGVTVVVAVGGPTTAAVEFGTTDKLGQIADGSQSGLVPFAADVHKIRLDDLSPGTDYFYRVRVTQIAFKNAYAVKRGAETVTEIHRFRTLAAGQDTCSFTVINDTHEHGATLKTLAGRVRGTPVDFAFWNGDVFNEVHDPAQMATQLVGFMGNGPVAADQPMQLLRGNHDVRGVMARDFGRYADVAGGRYYGSFRQGPVAFVCLDSGEDKPDDHPVYAGLTDFAAFRTRQRAWLEAELRQPHITSAPFRVLFVHIPLRWTNEQETGSWCSDGRAKWNDLIVAAKFDLVISGHTHRHAFLPADGTFPYAQLVGGGPVLSAATFIHATADAKRLTVQMTQATGEPIGEYAFPARTA